MGIIETKDNVVHLFRLRCRVMKKELALKLKKAARFLLNPRLLFCAGIAWIITNGWSYIMLAMGLFLDVTWMKAVGSGYMAFLWFPMTPEKILTIAIAIALLRRFFPDDKDTLAVLQDMRRSVKEAVKKVRKTKIQPE